MALVASAALASCGDGQDASRWRRRPGRRRDVVQQYLRGVCARRRGCCLRADDEGCATRHEQLPPGERADSCEGAPGSSGATPSWSRGRRSETCDLGPHGHGERDQQGPAIRQRCAPARDDGGWRIAFPRRGREPVRGSSRNQAARRRTTRTRMSAPESTPRRRRVLSRRRVVALAVCLAALARWPWWSAWAARTGAPADRRPPAGAGRRACATPRRRRRIPEPASAEAHPLAASPGRGGNLGGGDQPRRPLRRGGATRPAGAGALLRPAAGVEGRRRDACRGASRRPRRAPRARSSRPWRAGTRSRSFPYRWGGGHGSFIDDAYDCSGSVSYALAAAGMLDAPLASGDLMRVGESPVPGGGSPSTQTRPRVHGGGRAAVRHQRPRRAARLALAGARRSGRGFEARHWPGL